MQKPMSRMDATSPAAKVCSSALRFKLALVANTCTAVARLTVLWDTNAIAASATSTAETLELARKPPQPWLPLAANPKERARTREKAKEATKAKVARAGTD